METPNAKHYEFCSFSELSEIRGIQSDKFQRKTLLRRYYLLAEWPQPRYSRMRLILSYFLGLRVTHEILYFKPRVAGAA